MRLSKIVLIREEAFLAICFNLLNPLSARNLANSGLSVFLLVELSLWYSLSLAAKQFFWIVCGLHQIVDKNMPTTLFNDNNAAIGLAHNPEINDATNHIYMKYHFTREEVTDGSLLLLRCPSDKNLADKYTKGLPKPRLNHLFTRILGTK